MKKLMKLCAVSVVLAMALAFTGCGGNDNGEEASGVTGRMSVITREEGSGTRGAFVEIVGVTDANGNDNITMQAQVQSGTGAMMSAVAGNPQAIGYASTGTLDDRTRALAIDGIEPTVENMLSGAYALQRPFVIGYNTANGLSDLAQDFWNFIFSAQGQELIESRGLVPIVANAPQYTPSGLTGRIVVHGSSSVEDIMSRLAYAYQGLNPDVVIDVSGPGTGHGITAAREGLADIAMASRDIRPAEAEILTYATMALDGIAIIVHPSNDIAGLTMEQARNIFLGEINTWENIR